MKKDNNLDAFFVLVCAGLWERDVELRQFGIIDYAEVLRIATEQSVVGLVGAGIECVRDIKVPQVDALLFVGQLLQIEQRNKAMNNFVADLVGRMRRVDIYTLIVKGQGIAQCYEKPFWRLSGDVDLFLSDDNYNKAKSFLQPLGVETQPEERDKKHFAIKIGDWDVELHGTLHSGLSFILDRIIDKVSADVFYGGKVRSWINGKTQIFLPAPDEDVVFVFAHIIQHFYKGGIGLRQICDWCRLLYTYKESLNYGLLEQRIRKSGLMSEWKTFAAFAVEYLGMPIDAMPLLDADIDLNANLKRKAERIKDFVMEVGNFGHNRDNSYFQKHSYLARKCISAWRRVKDLFRHARIFPVNSVRFFFGIMWNGVVSAVRGE